ncbi:MAG: hypothetical protein QXN05_03950 [Acidilobaceae archaeon]
MERKLLVLGTLAIVALLAVANAAAFAYRWLSGTITVVGPEQAAGATCTGFYSSAAQPGIPLPLAGTNYNAVTYGNNYITITPGDVVCRFNDYMLYESISVTLPLAVGSWYIKDFYGFGYYSRGVTTPTYVTLVVEDAITEIPVTVAELRVYKGSLLVTKLDLTIIGYMASFTLDPDEGVQLDLFIDAQSAGTATFRVGFYVSHSTEPPR